MPTGGGRGRQVSLRQGRDGSARGYRPCCWWGSWKAESNPVGRSVGCSGGGHGGGEVSLTLGEGLAGPHWV